MFAIVSSLTIHKKNMVTKRNSLFETYFVHFNDDDDDGHWKFLQFCLVSYRKDRIKYTFNYIIYG